MSLLDRTTLRILFTVLATSALLAFVWLARKPLLVFLFAMLFAYLLEPLVARLQRRLHCSRGIAIAVTYVAMLAVLLVRGTAGGAARGGAGTTSVSVRPGALQQGGQRKHCLPVRQGARMEPADAGSAAAVHRGTPRRGLQRGERTGRQSYRDRRQRAVAAADSNPGGIFLCRARAALPGASEACSTILTAASCWARSWAIWMRCSPTLCGRRCTWRRSPQPSTWSRSR